LRARKSAGGAALLVGILVGAATAHAAEPAASNDDETTAKQFAAAIDSFNALDPQSPDTLDTRLAYANFLTNLERGDCSAHLDEAQSQLNVAKDNPAVSVVLPAALARIAAVEYQLHSARVSCGVSAAARNLELQAALEAAQRAVDLYRDAFDAVAMATMQFNVSVAYHELGDADAAAAALRTTLDLDREYGFANDAAENYRLLLQWTHADDGPEQVAAGMKDFPQRSATLAFGWLEGDAMLTLQSEVSQLAGTDSLHFKASRTARRLVRKGFDGWTVSHVLDDPHFELGELPTNEWLESSFANSVARMLAHFHDFRLKRNGDFDQSKGDFRFWLRARADAKTLAGKLGAPDFDTNSGHAARLARRIELALKDSLLPEAIEAQAGEDYNLETGTWIGATLEQGVWYDMTAALFLPLAPQVFLSHKIQFTYSRSVPCVPGSEASCIEIVLRAAPDPTVLKASLDSLAHRWHLARGQAPRLWSVTSIRLVTDPATLRTYSRETRWHAYWSNGVAGPDQSLMESERTIETLSPR
jgi:tetratricopeptide (TPR) repeat protein